MMQVRRMPVAMRFLSLNKFLMQVRGPFIEASPAMSAKIVKVKHTTNLSGAATIVPSMIMLRKPKKVARKNAMPACTQFLSLPRKLKILSHPCGSGSDLPKTNYLAFASFAPMPSEADSFGALAAVGSLPIEVYAYASFSLSLTVWPSRSGSDDIFIYSCYFAFDFSIIFYLN